MGGHGSGWHRGARARCERRVALDLANCKLEPRDRLSKSWRDRGEYRGLVLGVDGAGIVIEYFLCDPAGCFTTAIASELAPFHAVPQRFGGVRRLLRCPGCHRRCRILYFGTDQLRCRKCLDLRYASQNMQPRQRALAQAAKLVRRIDPDAMAIDGLAPKPPRMRWRTYERLGERHARQMDRWAAELIAQLRDDRDQ
jgi:hypothetical protein